MNHVFEILLHVISLVHIFPLINKLSFHRKCFAILLVLQVYGISLHVISPIHIHALINEVFRSTGSVLEYYWCCS